MIKEALLIVVFQLYPHQTFVIKENMNKNENLYVMNVLYTVAYIPNSISVIKKKKKTHLMILACFVSFHVIMDVILYILKWIMLTPHPHPIADQDYTMDKH